MVPPRWIFLFLVLFLTTSAPTAARQDRPAPLDLAAVALIPADLAAVGWDDLGLSSGQTLSVVDLADRAVWPTGEGPEQDAVRDALLAAGWQQAYAATFATFWDPNRADLGRQVEVEVVAYADAAGAATGFTLVPDVFPTGPVETIAGASGIGDESRLFRVDARDPQAGVPAQELALGFRHGRLTARVLLRDWTGAEPRVDTLEALATRLLARIEHVVQDSGPDLSIRALRVQRPDSALYSDFYVRLDGEDVRSTYESPVEFAARVASYVAAIDVFTSATEIAASDSSYRSASALISTASRTRIRPRPGFGRNRPLEQETDVTSLAVEDGITGIGDRGDCRDDGPRPGRDGLEVTHVSAVLFRSDAMVAVIQLARIYDPTPGGAARELAAAQAACLAADRLSRPPAAARFSHRRPEERRLGESNGLRRIPADPVGSGYDASTLCGIVGTLCSW